MLDLKQPWVKVATVLLCSIVLMASGGIQSAYNTIQNSGTPLTKRTTVNMTGSGVSCADSGGITVCTINGTGVANYTQSFTSQTSVTLTHNLGTTAVLTQCFDGASPPNLIVPSNIAITDANDVTVTFSTSQTGECIVNGAAAGTATSVPFSGITTATNSTAAMTLGTGATLTVSGSGVNNANQANGAVFPASATVAGTNAARQVIAPTATVVTAFLNTFTSLLQGLVPASGGGTVNFLRADGTFAPPPGSTGGGLVLSITTKTTTYLFLPTDYAINCNATGGGFTTSLEASPANGQIHVWKKIDSSSNICTLSGNGNNIDTTATLTTAVQDVSYTVQFDGTQWWIE